MQREPHRYEITQVPAPVRNRDRLIGAANLCYRDTLSGNIAPVHLFDDFQDRGGIPARALARH